MAQSKGRLQFNGDLAFPKRGKPPIVPEGFMADPGDPYLLHKIYNKCANRYAHETRVPCCGAIKYTYFCKIDDFVTNYIRCGKCTNMNGAVS